MVPASKHQASPTIVPNCPTLPPSPTIDALPSCPTLPPSPILNLNRPRGPLSLDKLNSNVVNAKYAVRGRLAIRAEQLKFELMENPEKFPFKRLLTQTLEIHNLWTKTHFFLPPGLIFS